MPQERTSRLRVLLDLRCAAWDLGCRFTIEGDGKSFVPSNPGP